jgi:hypothetical protein
VNRSERRRQDREARKRTRVVVVGDGIVATGLGHHYRAEGGAELAAKVPGRHRWVAMSSHVLTDAQAATAYDDAARHLLGPDTLMYLAIGCWDCEQVLGEPDGVEVDSVCPAEGDD